jgi:glycosyltransferase involved in cell wall biosynthesis
LKSKDLPLVTFALFAYNQEEFIESAVLSAFSQTFSPMEIILSDDCSSDKTYEIIQKLATEYSGLNHVIVRRNQVNKGIASHFNDVLQLARGEFIIVAAGDDISLPTRTQISVDILNNNPKATFLDLDCLTFKQTDDLPRLSNDNRLYSDKLIESFTISDYTANTAPSLCGAARAFKVRSWLKFGMLLSSCPTEDTPSLVRLLIAGQGLKCSSIGIYRRLHDFNLSSKDSLMKMNLDNIRDQYINDILKAKQLNLISKATAHKLYKWAYGIIAWRIVLQTIDRGDLSAKFVFRHVLLSRYLSLRQRLHCIRVFLLAITQRTENSV